MGKTKIDGASGYLDPEAIIRIFSAKPAGTTCKDFAFQQGIIAPIPWEKMTPEKYREMTGEFLTQKYLTKTIMADLLKIKPEDICFIPQVQYHLDTFLAPGPQTGTVLLQDFRFAAKVAERLLASANELALDEEECRHLKIYQQTGEKLDKELGKLIKKGADKLTKAGFIVIPTPGVFMYETEAGKTYNINFMNGLQGWSSKTKKLYYLTTGAEVGTRLGKILMETFTQFLQGYDQKIEVYFTGRDPKNPSDYQASMERWNHVSSQSGPHCFSFEAERRVVNL